MSFDVAQFSQAGLNALAELTTTKTLKLKQIFVDETERYAEDLEENPSWWATQTATTNAKVNAEIMSIGVTNNQARIVMSLTLKEGQQSTVNVKTIVMSACVVNNGTEGNEITLCGIMDPNGIDVIYTASVIKISTKVSFYFKFNNASSITVQNAYAPDYALQGDLDRFVSCHIAGNAYAGEDQIIYGEKQYLASTHFGSDYVGTGCPQLTIATDNSNLHSTITSLTQPDEEDSPVECKLTFHSREENYCNCDCGAFSFNTHIIPNWDDALGDVSLGQPGAEFAELYVGYVNTDYADFTLRRACCCGRQCLLHHLPLVHVRL